MFSKTYSAGVLGIDGFIVDVEVDISNGIPCFNIIGLPDASIKEAKDRIKSAINNSGYNFINSKIVVNLSPADMRKEGSCFDTAMAIGILNKMFDFNEDILSKSIFLGELSLDGNIKSVRGILPSTIEAKNKGFENIFVPSKNLKESLLVDNIKIFPVDNLKQIIDFLLNKNNISFYERDKNSYICDYEEDVDFNEVRGNYLAKRACEICAAGGHNMLMIGPPGSGKTMIAKRIKTILPSMSYEECLQTTKIYSASGLLTDDNNIISKRPFRSPHHTTTKVSLIGGGYDAKAGEVVLAHNGILFLDEIAEFDKKILETLRQPIEDKYVNISRLKRNLKYCTDFLLIGAMNPCNCGFYGSSKECNCSIGQIKRYLNKLSGPLLDRFDLFVQVDALNYDEFDDEKMDSSLDIRKRIEECRNMQNDRYKNENINVNSDMNSKHIDKYCKLDMKCKEFLKKVFEKYNLSSRSYYKILKVSRTIADLDKSINVNFNHISEAIALRSTYFSYWG